MFDVGMLVSRRDLVTLGVLFVHEVLDDSFDEVREQIGGNTCADAEEYGDEHGVEKSGAFGLGEVGFGEGAGYVVFVPGVGKFFEGDVEVGGECDLIYLVVHGCAFPFYSFRLNFI